MKIIQATWEKRNFGCDAYEILLDKNDLQNVEASLGTIRAQNFADAYVVVKLPVGNLKLLHALEDEGFRFLETQLFLVDRFEPLEKPEQIERMMQGVERNVVPKKKDAWESIISRITPEMFDTDRVCLDPKLGKDIACLRYQNWCRDLFDNPNSWMWVLSVNNEEVSFGINVRDEKKGFENGILGGVFAPYKGLGYGVFQILDASESMKKTKTVVSSNNQGMLRVYQSYGRVIYKELYALRKIYPAKEV